MDDSTRSRIETLIATSPVFVFMKGSKLMPQCGFSNNVVQILHSLREQALWRCLGFSYRCGLDAGSVHLGVDLIGCWEVVVLLENGDDLLLIGVQLRGASAFALLGGVALATPHNCRNRYLFLK